MEGWDWFWAVVASSTGAAALLAIGAYLARSQLSHWLNKDLERAKAAHRRDLEAYKVTLIAESERAKAAQEVKKSGALKIIEKRFSAMHELHQALSGFAGEIMAVAGVAHAVGAAERFNNISHRVERLTRASSEYSIFLDQGEIAAFAEHFEILVQAYALCQPVTSAHPKEARSLSTELIARERICESIIGRHMSSLISLE